MRLLPKLLGLAVIAASAASAATAWTISTVAGTGAPATTGDGAPAISASTHDPYGVIRGPDGALWFCEHAGHRIRRIDTDGTISTPAGTGEKGYAGDGGPASQASFNLPHELRFDAAGNLFVADTGNNAIRRIDAKTGVITTIAGGPRHRGYSGDGGPAREAAFNGPHSIQFAADGGLYVCDVGNHAIRHIDLNTGTVSTIAGTGRPGSTPDGAPVSGTPLNNPRSLDVDARGDLWLVTREGNQVFQLDLRSNRVRLAAGTGQPGFTGNGGPAIAATLSGPKGIALDREGNAWLADTESHTVRRIDAKTGRIDVVAGTGAKGDGPEGNPLACALNRPHGVFVDTDGAIYIGDSEAHRVRVLRPAP